MKQILHITSGDTAGDLLKESAVSGDILVWHDVLYDGPRKPGMPDKEALEMRASFLSEMTGGALKSESIIPTLKAQYEHLKSCGGYEEVLLWFDGCLFDQSMLVHILACLSVLDIRTVNLICINAFDGIEPFNGLGQLNATQMASLVELRSPVTEAQFEFAVSVDNIFVERDRIKLGELSQIIDSPLPYVPAAAARLLLELPENESDLGWLESRVMEAVGAGCDNPIQIFDYISKKETPPQYWGDTTLWAKINALADRTPPLLKIVGGRTPHLPQWPSTVSLSEFKVLPEN